MSGFYDIAVQSIDGSPDLLGKLRGKVALAVNVASRCGLTPQYEGLETLQRELQGKDFTIIGPVVNMASRIQGAAGVGEILVSGDVYEQVRNLFSGTESRQFDLKGIDQPTTLHRLVA